MKRNLILTLYFMLLVGIISGVSQGVKLPETLKDNSAILPVKGRMGMQINQVITFGDFKTSKIKKGWTKSTKVTSTNSVLFASKTASVSKASQKFSFTQFGPDNMEAEVACLGELSQADIELIKNIFAIGIDFKNCFSGSIEIVNDSTTWEFIIIDPDSKPDTDVSSGFIRNGNDELIELYAITELEGKKIPKFLQGAVQGYEFRLNGKPIGAVSLYNKGNVIFYDNISDTHKLVIASLSTALLVRTDLNDQ
ncbi:MAG: hypothetical protein HQ521_15215 [Bacteroidetes bacterium]|nr:hypothetical protein [Bacteroidota bacterium]